MRPSHMFALVVVLAAGCLSAPAPPQPATANDAAHAIVLSEPYPDLVIEADYLPKAPPSQEALRALVEVLDAYTLKRSVVLLPPEEIEPGAATRARGAWSIEEVYAAHEATFRSDRPWKLGNSTHAYLHVLYLDSYLWTESNGKNVAASGVAMQNVIVVFRGAAEWPVVPNAGAMAEGEVPILIHELGHAMGLVGLGVPEARPHALPDDPHHSRNPESVMYAGFDLLGFAQESYHDATAKPLDLFDADDKADLATLRAEQDTRA